MFVNEKECLSVCLSVCLALTPAAASPPIFAFDCLSIWRKKPTISSKTLNSLQRTQFLNLSTNVSLLICFNFYHKRAQIDETRSTLDNSIASVCSPKQHPSKNLPKFYVWFCIASTTEHVCRIVYRLFLFVQLPRC